MNKLKTTTMNGSPTYAKYHPKNLLKIIFFFLCCLLICNAGKSQTITVYEILDLFNCKIETIIDFCSSKGLDSLYLHTHTYTYKNRPSEITYKFRHKNPPSSFSPWKIWFIMSVSYTPSTHYVNGVSLGTSQRLFSRIKKELKSKGYRKVQKIGMEPLSVDEAMAPSSYNYISNKYDFSLSEGNPGCYSCLYHIDVRRRDPTEIIKIRRGYR